MYGLASVVFALMYYNRRQPFSLGALLHPLMGNRLPRKANTVLDAVCLYSLVAGMSAVLGVGMLTIAGGLGSVANLENTPLLLGIIGAAIVIAFVVSASTGLMRGIRILFFLEYCCFYCLASVRGADNASGKNMV